MNPIRLIPAHMFNRLMLWPALRPIGVWLWHRSGGCDSRPEVCPEHEAERERFIMFGTGLIEKFGVIDAPLRK